MKDKYIRQALRAMNLPKKRKEEIRRDLEEIFASALEHGESEEQVIARLGTPGEYAAEVSGGRAGRKKRHIVELACIAATSAIACFSLFLSTIMRTVEIQVSTGEGATGSIGIIGGADGPTKILVAGPPQDPADTFLWTGVVLLILTALQIVRLVRLKKRTKRSEE